MEVTRKLRKVGGSIMVPLPPEILQEAGLVVDASVVIRSRRGHVEIEPEAKPDTDAMEFMDSFLSEYSEAMEKLAKR
jgi:antitoxin component of MazEF toxin-antitoxin module